jgi:hypothetical protein
MTEVSLNLELANAVDERVRLAIVALSETKLRSPVEWPGIEAVASAGDLVDFLYAYARTVSIALAHSGESLTAKDRRRCSIARDRLYAVAGINYVYTRAASGLSADDLASLVLAGARLQRADAESEGRPSDVLWGPATRKRGRPPVAKYEAADLALLAEFDRRVLQGEAPSRVWDDLAARAPGNSTEAARQRLQVRHRAKPAD